MAMNLLWHRVAPGHYRAQVHAYTIEVSRVVTDDGETAWYWTINGSGGDDWYPTRRAATFAALDWLRR